MIEYKAIYSKDMESGLIRFINIDFGKYDTMLNAKNFTTEHDIKITKYPNTFWHADLKMLYLSKGKVPVTININGSKDFFEKVISTIEAFNKAMEISNIELHEQFWKHIADSDGTINTKEDLIKDFCHTHNIKDIPANGCFLCEEAKNEKGQVDCMKCPAYRKWGANNDEWCISPNSYYNMWKNENDPDFRNAIAMKISKIFIDYNLTQDEINTLTSHGKLLCIKNYRDRTKLSLVQSKRNVENFIFKSNTPFIPEGYFCHGLCEDEFNEVMAGRYENAARMHSERTGRDGYKVMDKLLARLSEVILNKRNNVR